MVIRRLIDVTGTSHRYRLLLRRPATLASSFHTVCRVPTLADCADTLSPSVKLHSSIR